MDDNTANKYVDAFFDRIVNSRNDEEKRRMIRLLVKEVERDTRHIASSIAPDAQHEIMNMGHEPTLSPFNLAQHIHSTASAALAKKNTH